MRALTIQRPSPEAVEPIEPVETIDKPSTPHRQKGGAKLFIHFASRPAGAPRWQSGADRRRWLIQWDKRVAADLRTAQTTKLVAFKLHQLFSMRAFAFVGDAALAGMAGVSVPTVQRALRDLEDAGLLIRAHIFREGKKEHPERRLYPTFPQPPTDQQ